MPVEWLISKDYAAERVELIDPRRASRSVRPGDPELDSDTIYMTAADKDGNMISLIQSIYSQWGSALVPDGLGFAMHNRGVSYSLDPEHPNRLEPHKRPFHTIIPAFVTENGAPLLSFGVMGGSFQPQGHSQVLMNMLDFGMSPQQAGDQPRVEHFGSSQPATGLVEGAVRSVSSVALPTKSRLRLPRWATKSRRASRGRWLSGHLAHRGAARLFRRLRSTQGRRCAGLLRCSIVKRRCAADHIASV